MKSAASVRRLRSANVPTFMVPRTRTKLGDRSFAAAGPRLWNSLPGPKLPWTGSFGEVAVKDFGLKGTSRLVADITGSRHSGLGFTVFWLFTAEMICLRFYCLWITLRCKSDRPAELCLTMPSIRFFLDNSLTLSLSSVFSRSNESMSPCSTSIASSCSLHTTSNNSSS